MYALSGSRLYSRLSKSSFPNCAAPTTAAPTTAAPTTAAPTTTAAPAGTGGAAATADAPRFKRRAADSRIVPGVFASAMDKIKAKVAELLPMAQLVDDNAGDMNYALPDQQALYLAPRLFSYVEEVRAGTTAAPSRQ